MSRDELSLFSYEILGLVGRTGAGAHDLLRWARRGRMLAWAGESQYYVEPKRLAKLGYLAARREPGKTRERTVYTLTDKGLAALREYAATPVLVHTAQERPAAPAAARRSRRRGGRPGKGSSRCAGSSRSSTSGSTRARKRRRSSRTGGSTSCSRSRSCAGTSTSTPTSSTRSSASSPARTPRRSVRGRDDGFRRRREGGTPGGGSRKAGSRQAVAPTRATRIDDTVPSARSPARSTVRRHRPG